MKLTEATWMFLDTETTGLKPKEGARVIEFGSAFVDTMRVSETYDFLINPEGPIPAKITQITGISDKHVANKPPFKDVAKSLMAQFNSSEFVAAYNKDFDRQMLEHEFAKFGMKMPELIWLDPMIWARSFAQAEDNKLKTIANQFGVDLSRAHRADADAEAGANVLIKFFQWGVEEANFPDDVEALKDLERSWKRSQRAQSGIMAPLRKSVDGKRPIVMTGEPGEYAQNVYDNYNRDRLMKLGNRGRWGK